MSRQPTTPARQTEANTLAAFFASRWTSDGGFVETGETRASLEATRFACEAAKRAGALLPASDVAITQWVLGLRAQAGGFYPDSRRLRQPAAATYYATRTLHILGAADRIEASRGTLCAWIEDQSTKAKCQNIDELYYLVRCYALLAQPRWSPRASHWRAFANDCRAQGGGIANRPGEAPDIEHSYCGAHLLLLLGASSTELMAERVFAEGCVAPGGHIRWAPESDRTSLATLYWGLHLQHLLDGDYPWPRAARVVDAHMHATGGFGANEPTLWETYCAVSSRLIAGLRLGLCDPNALIIE